MLGAGHSCEAREASDRRLPASHVGIEKITWLLRPAAPTTPLHKIAALLVHFARGVEFFLTMIKLIFTPESGGNPAVEAVEVKPAYDGAPGRACRGLSADLDAVPRLGPGPRCRERERERSTRSRIYARPLEPARAAEMLQQTVKLGMRAMPSKDGIVQSEGLVLGPWPPSYTERALPPPLSPLSSLTSYAPCWGKRRGVGGAAAGALRARRAAGLRCRPRRAALAQKERERERAQAHRSVSALRVSLRLSPLALSRALLELRVKWMIELMKIEGKWDAKKA